MKKYIKLAIGILFTTVFLFLSYKNVGQLELKKVFTYKVNYPLTVIAVLFFIAAHWLRSLAWSKGLNKHLKTIGVFKGICMGSATNMVMPFRMGEPIRIAILGNAHKTQQDTKDKHFYYHVGVNIVFERVLDMCIFGALALVSLFVVDFNEDIQKKIYWLRNLMLIGLLIALILIGVFYYIRKNNKIHSTWLEKLFRFIEELSIAKSPRLIIPVLFYLFLSWMSVYICTGIVLLSIGIVPSQILSIALIVLIMTNLAVLLPAAPGGIGVFEYACIYSMGLFGISGLPAAVAAIVLHLVQYAAMLPLGLYLFIKDRRYFLNLVK